MSLIWQADFYRIPLQYEKKEILWELLICDQTRNFEFVATCPQSQANSQWVAQQLQLAGGDKLPDIIQVFRPQSLGLITVAANSLDIKVEATRRTLVLKQWLAAKQYPIDIDKPAPLPLPENLWGEEWAFGTIPSSNIVDEFADRPIPILQIPESIKPINLGLASTVAIPGVIIYGGRKSMVLAQWLQESTPVELNYLAGDPNGLVLESGLVDRWILATFTDAEVTAAGKLYQQRKRLSRGLHFLVVQPDKSGMTYSGFWLLQDV
ncbi:Tab2/Atab2 family RNA-binding protein [Cuspidothrix issatschenkoi LEGE 03284]|uniref:Tab2/Atab2 family RNA-binding protein n=1 Tax=Cuspidothrix issatschenkoi TaxID=230752 RepID=UPI001882F477|nr:Tab2/Atab2 family RNA-binding protein [Cuspidothrix issatschenkoi]MBE9232583.1 Tab2/Atab2 family RNA-binding protein [Cuspidothrix issatschenkoi LEGE 03284]